MRRLWPSHSNAGKAVSTGAAVQRETPSNPFVRFEREQLGQTIPDCFEKQVVQWPARIAVKTSRVQLSYLELNLAANRLAHALLRRGGPPDQRVAVVVDHGWSVVAAILGVLKAGRICVPIDPSYPAARAADLLQHVQADCIVTDDQMLAFAASLAGAERPVINLDACNAAPSTENPRRTTSAATISHILYTSGSSGRPKGVICTHQNLLGSVRSFTNGLQVCAGDRIALLASCSSGQGMSTALLALLNGATLCPFNLREQGVEGLAEFLLRERITIYVSAPTVFRHFARTLTAAEAFPDLRIVRLGGEAVRVKDVLLYQRWFGRQAILVNSFSSTETGNVTQYHIHGDTDISSNRVPVGFAVEDMRVSLLDDDGQEVGPDRIGEIAVQSRCLSLGYWREPELTQAVFRPAADGGERIYRTGDLGRLRSDGCLEHLGRKDAQIKLRGHRIELEEVELLLSRHPAVQAAVVEAREDRLEDSCLVAFVVPRQPNKIETAELRSYLRNNLPEHMVPSAFILLQSLPMLPSGKVDRQALPGDHRPAGDGGPDRHQPGNPLEQRLAAIWCEVLGLKEVGTQDNFFNLGGHSLRAAQVISRLRAAIGVEVPLRLLFEKPTIAELAETVNRYLISGRAAPQAALPSITT